MPPRMPRRPIARSKGSDPTVSIATAASLRTTLNTQEQAFEEQVQEEPKQAEQGANDDLKKLIEALKNKLGNANNTPQKKAPPPQKSKAAWNRSITAKKEPGFSPAYTILTRISNHEKVPIKTNKQAAITINSVPHSFLYRPGVDGIKVDKLDIKSGKQLGMG